MRDLRSLGRFRVNAQRARHDVWLLYACPGCDATHKRRLFRRRRTSDFGPEGLDAYRRDDAVCAWRHAFELPARRPLRHRVVASAAAEGGFVARIEQPDFCAVRWDSLLSRQLGWSRSRTARALRAAIASDSRDRALRPRDCVRDGQGVRIGADGASVRLCDPGVR